MKQKITNISYMSLLNQINQDYKEDKVNQAIELYQQGAGTIGYLSEKIGILKHDLIYEFRIRNIEPNFSEITLKEELG